MKITELLIGKKVKIMTDAKVEVNLEIKSAKFKSHSRELEPATRKNDWWPKTQDWTTLDIEFTNGFKKSYDNIEQINLIE